MDDKLFLTDPGGVIIDDSNIPDHPGKSNPPSTRSQIIDMSGDPYAGKEVYLSIEGGQEVFYRGTYVTKIPLTGESLTVGRRDVMSGHYPDIDLAMYWRQDRTISRKHLQIFRDINGAYFVEDLSNNNATYLNNYKHPLNKSRVELKPGDRILVSMSIAIDFCVI